MVVPRSTKWENRIKTLDDIDAKRQHKEDIQTTKDRIKQQEDDHFAAELLKTISKDFMYPLQDTATPGHDIVFS